MLGDALMGDGGASYGDFKCRSRGANHLHISTALQHPSEHFRIQYDRNLSHMLPVCPYLEVGLYRELSSSIPAYRSHVFVEALAGSC